MKNMTPKNTIFALSLSALSLGGCVGAVNLEKHAVNFNEDDTLEEGKIDTTCPLIIATDGLKCLPAEPLPEKEEEEVVFITASEYLSTELPTIQEVTKDQSPRAVVQLGKTHQVSNYYFFPLCEGNVRDPYCDNKRYIIGLKIDYPVGLPLTENSGYASYRGEVSVDGVAYNDIDFMVNFETKAIDAIVETPCKKSTIAYNHLTGVRVYDCKKDENNLPHPDITININGKIKNGNIITGKFKYKEAEVVNNYQEGGTRVYIRSQDNGDITGIIGKDGLVGAGVGVRNNNTKFRYHYAYPPKRIGFSATRKNP